VLEQETPTPFAESEPTQTLPRDDRAENPAPWEGYSPEILDAILDP